MKKTLNFMFALAVLGLGSSVAMAAPISACSVGENVLSAGFSCSIGSLTFSNFSSNTNEAPPTIGIQAISADGFTLNPNVPTNGNPPLNDIYLQFEVSGGVSGVGLGLNGSPNAYVNENVCSSQQGTSGVTLGVCSGTELAFISVQGGQTASASFTSTNPIWIFKDINDGQSSISEVNQVYTSGVPEPMTLSMMGAGLLGLSLISRRRKKS